ncbi:ADP-ribosylglycohydrolase family protein [Rothia nasimurium]|uniref:ADP-ribosylglycohydrolase family protein n=1 Tax=Rothia nasimurium TaxID=85336 RepID=UPI003BA1AA99
MSPVFPAPNALSPTYRAALRGCLYGTALGDALGYPVETLTRAQMFETFGCDSPQELIAALASQPLKISDDTQLTLATLDGLTEVLEWNNEGQAADELACIWLAYLRWYTGTGHPAPETAPFSLPRPLDSLEVMRQQRGPGKATLAALAEGEMQFISKNVNPEALGTGALMRSAPFGYLPVEDDATVIKLSAHAAALTHGHPEAIISASAYALLIRYLLGSHETTLASPLRTAVEQVLIWLAGVKDSQALPGTGELTAEALRNALQISETKAPASEAQIHFGNLVLAPDCLGYALYLALTAETNLEAGADTSAPDLLMSALADALAVDGDSDSIAALVGSMLGALGTEAVLPQALLTHLDAQDALDLVEAAWFKQLGL